MNIAFFRVMKTFTTGFQRLTMGGGEELSTILKELHARGHRITVYCQTNDKEAAEAVKLGFRVAQDAPRIDSDEDLLLVDNGPGMNMLWNETQLVLPQRMARFYTLVKSMDSDIPLIYAQTDCATGMRLLTEVDEWMDLPSKAPLRNFVSVPKEPLKDRKIVVLFPQQDTQAFATKLVSKYSNYPKRVMATEHLDFSLTFLFDREPLPAVDATRNMVYVGNSRARRRLKLYYNRPDAFIYGKWTSASAQAELPLAPKLGPLPVSQAMSVYQDGRLHAVVRDNVELGFGARPPRVFEAVFGGTPTYVDIETFGRPGVSKYWDWIISPDQVDDHIERLHDESVRKQLLSDQRDYISKINYRDLIDSAELILDKYKK